MNEKIVLLNKQSGLTPLQTIELFREKNPAYKGKTLSYAGRLDPMAEGLLLILVDEENKNRNSYMNLSKMYEFEILIGVSSDTYDGMGRIIDKKDVIVSGNMRQAIDIHLQSLRGKHTFSYPPYSSKTVKGKPLHWYAKRDLLSTITVPTREVVISDINSLSLSTLKNQEILTSITQRIERVQGNFRQKEIISDWDVFFRTKQIHHMSVLRCTATVTSGTYIRGLIHELEKKTGIPMLAYTIKRTSVGNFSLAEAL